MDRPAVSAGYIYDPKMNKWLFNLPKGVLLLLVVSLMWYIKLHFVVSLKFVVWSTNKDFSFYVCTGMWRTLVSDLVYVVTKEFLTCIPTKLKISKYV